MIMRMVSWLLLLALWISVHDALAASTLSCGTRLVRVGDSKAEVFRICGEPAWREKYDEEWWQKERDRGIRHGGSIAHEQWVYNFGPTQFMQYLYFENGRLVKIERGDYGYTRAPGKPKTCTPEVLEQTTSKNEVLESCGEPYFKDEREEIRIQQAGSVTRKFNVTVEEWTYDFGATRFMRTIVFENGHVVDIRLGDHGGGR